MSQRRDFRLTEPLDRGNKTLSGIRLLTRRAGLFVGRRFRVSRLWLLVSDLSLSLSLVVRGREGKGRKRAWFLSSCFFLAIFGLRFVEVSRRKESIKKFTREMSNDPLLVFVVCNERTGPRGFFPCLGPAPPAAP